MAHRIIIPKWGYKLKLIIEMKEKTYKERGRFGRTYRKYIKKLKQPL
jgi:hypothetical protein